MAPLTDAMDKPKPPASPRRMATMHLTLPRGGSIQSRGDAPGDDNGGLTEQAADGTETVSSGSSPTGTRSSGSSTQAGASPRIDRGVRTRTHDRITLPLNASGELDAGRGLERGWWSPHGEPYRPLGNPELSLKLTPRLPADSPSRSKTVQDSNAKDGNGQREPSRVGAAASPPPSQVDSTVLEMFPRNLGKRPPEDRQARLMTRLQESISQYSPSKVRGLRRKNPITVTRVGDGDSDGGLGDEARDDEDVHAAILRLQEQHYHYQQQANASSASSPSQTPRYHVEHGDTSVHILHGAVQDGVSRLRLVRNGQHFLDNVPLGGAFDFTVLKRHYDKARERFVVDQENRKKLGPSMRLGSAAHDDYDDADDADSGKHSGGHSIHKPPPSTVQTGTTPRETIEHVYLPYTTREPQTSPHKQLPTLAEFKAKIREERMPQRTLLSSRASMATMGVPPSPPSPVSPSVAQRKSSTRQSRVGSMLIANASSPPLSERLSSIAQLPISPSPPKLLRGQTRRGSIMLAAPGAGGEILVRSSLLGDVSGDALARVVAQVASAPVSPRAHSVVRLQTTVDAMENVKVKRSEMLAKTLTLLDHDRRDCLTMKFRNLHLESRAESDLPEMRVAAEAARVGSVQLSLARFQWYPDLLRQMLANRESPVLHPAELFCVDVIRHVANEGHAFESEQLYRLVLLLHREDIALSEVQQLLTFLRRALVIPMADWEAFFRAHGLPEPVEIFKQNEAKTKDKKRMQRMAKLRTVVTLNSVLRRLTTPQTPSVPSP